LNLIPTSTGVSKAISLVLPHLGPKITGLAIRVPTPNVSLVDLSLNFKKVVSKASVHHALKDASKHAFKGVVSVDEERLVSSDFISSPFSAIVIGDQIMTIGEKNAKVLAWYDNEMGYSERLIDMVQYIAQN
ncbi:hypothetical protein L930_08975, partial [Helicobacter pylori PZ5004]